MDDIREVSIQQCFVERTQFIKDLTLLAHLLFNTQFKKKTEGEYPEVSIENNSSSSEHRLTINDLTLCAQLFNTIALEGAC
jgi:hypothetical protein